MIKVTTAVHSEIDNRTEEQKIRDSVPCLCKCICHNVVWLMAKQQDGIIRATVIDNASCITNDICPIGHLDELPELTKFRLIEPGTSYVLKNS